MGSVTGVAVGAGIVAVGAAIVAGADSVAGGLGAPAPNADSAGAAGAAFSSVFYVFPAIGGLFTVKAFEVIVLGGLGNVVGAFFAGILLAVATHGFGILLMVLAFLALGISHLVYLILEAVRSYQGQLIRIPTIICFRMVR